MYPCTMMTMTTMLLAIGALLVSLAPFWMLFKARTAAADLPGRRARLGVACVAVVVADVVVRCRLQPKRS